MRVRARLPAVPRAAHEVVLVLHHGVEGPFAVARLNLRRHVRRYLRFTQRYLAAWCDARHRQQAVHTESGLYMLGDAGGARYGGMSAGRGAGKERGGAVAYEALATAHKWRQERESAPKDGERCDGVVRLFKANARGQGRQREVVCERFDFLLGVNEGCKNIFVKV